MFKLKLKNYRGFVDEEFDFSRVNILIGENSSGKSSIFKFLLALKQSLRPSNSHEYNLTLSGTEIDLGNYEEIIYKHEIGRKLYFSFEFGAEYIDFFLKHMVPAPKDSINIEESEQKRKAIRAALSLDELGSEVSLRFQLTSDLSKHQNVFFSAYSPIIGELSITLPLSEQEIYVRGGNSLCTINFIDVEGNQVQLDEISFEKRAFLTIIEGDSLRHKLKTLGEENAKIVFDKIAYLLVAQNYLEATLQDIQYSNPLLHEPAERIYLKRDEKITFNIKDIREVIYLLSGENFLKEKSLESFVNDYRDLLIAFGIISEFVLQKDNFTRELRVNVGGIFSNIKDVGYGVSLQMPIFAQALISEKSSRASGSGELLRNGAVLLIEQPEAHLHPSLQAKFIRSLLSIGKNNIYFIETHSEHIIRMLQLMVKNNEYDLKAEDISISYLRKENGNVIKTTHNINPETGKLKPAFPKGFYDVSYDLAFQLMD